MAGQISPKVIAPVGSDREVGMHARYVGIAAAAALLAAITTAQTG